MTFLAKIKDSLRFRRAVKQTALLPENAPTAEFSVVKPRVDLPEIANRMVGVAQRTDGFPNHRRRALFYENDFYARFH